MGLDWLSNDVERIVLLPSVEGVGDRWFLADLRRYDLNDEGSWWWCVHSATSSRINLLGDIESNLRHVGNGYCGGVMVFQAKNRTEVGNWLMRHGFPTRNQAGTLVPSEGEIMEGKKAYLQARIDAMQDQLFRLEMLPDEPGGSEDANVIWWTAQFSSSSRQYTYAAVKAGDGLWYTSGPATPKGYSWEHLIGWIADEAKPVDGVIWVATEFESVPLP